MPLTLAAFVADLVYQASRAVVRGVIEEAAANPEKFPAAAEAIGYGFARGFRALEATTASTPRPDPTLDQAIDDANRKSIQAGELPASVPPGV